MLRLDDETFERLVRLAQRTGRSRAELQRAAIVAYLDSNAA